MELPDANWDFWRLLIEAIIIPILIRIWLVLSKINSTLAVFNEKHENTQSDIEEIKQWQMKQDETIAKLNEKLSNAMNECALRHQGGYNAKPKGRFHE